MLQAIFPGLTVEWWEEVAFELSWHNSNGCGLGRSYQELLKMPLDHIMRDLERVGKRRQREAEQVRDAAAASASRAKSGRRAR